MLSFERFEIFKQLLASFFPLALLILAVLGSIVFGLATPTEALALQTSECSDEECRPVARA